MPWQRLRDRYGGGGALRKAALSQERRLRGAGCKSRPDFPAPAPGINDIRKKNSIWVANLPSNLSWFCKLGVGGEEGLSARCPLRNSRHESLRIPRRSPTLSLPAAASFPCSTVRSSPRVVNYCKIGTRSPLARDESLNVIKQSRTPVKAYWFQRTSPSFTAGI